MHYLHLMWVWLRMGNIVCQVNEGVGDEEEVPALPYVLALHAFCVVDPTLCVPATDQSQFVVTLQPYLKNQVKFIFLFFPFICSSNHDELD
jgi:hypothetical protein